MLRRVLIVFALSVLVLSALVAPSQGAGTPSRATWLADTRQAMYGSRAWINERVASGEKGLAVNLDIDNTSLATYYARGTAVPVTLRFAKYAQSRHVVVLFNTGRNQKGLARAVRDLRKAGYPVDGICGRRTGEALTHSKQRCRQQYVDRGFTIIANVGNRRTDFVGTNYERAFRLPNYGNRLG
jgi:predicted secreted acid phosphatase